MRIGGDNIVLDLARAIRQLLGGSGGRDDNRQPKPEDWPLPPGGGLPNVHKGDFSARQCCHFFDCDSPVRSASR
jgi:hypothetical protein